MHPSHRLLGVHLPVNLFPGCWGDSATSKGSPHVPQQRPGNWSGRLECRGSSSTAIHSLQLPQYPWAGNSAVCSQQMQHSLALAGLGLLGLSVCARARPGHVWQYGHHPQEWHSWATCAGTTAPGIVGLLSLVCDNCQPPSSLLGFGP